MKRIAILGGGIAGLAAAYELELARKRGADIDWHLYEATGRLGGILETTTIDGFVMEGGPDAWVTDKPWARDLAVELGLEAGLIESNDASKRTYILIDGKLQPMPQRMRMMVPEDLAALDDSSLFSPSACAAYADELRRADELRADAPATDESVADFVRRHFGEEVLTKLAAPLLSGVFGGDVHKLSVRSVMPAFVAMEQEHGSLIAAVQAKAKTRGDKPPAATFTTLRNGMGSLVDALVATLPPERLHLMRRAASIKRESGLWCVRTTATDQTNKDSRRTTKRHVHHVLVATSAGTAQHLLAPVDFDAAELLPRNASSAVLATFRWTPKLAARFTIPPGFGFLVPPLKSDPCSVTPDPCLLACTFTDQKFPGRAPAGAHIIRAFFGGDAAEALLAADDAVIASAALTQLRQILGELPEPAQAIVHRWPRSLPQYEVGHLDRMAQLDAIIETLPGIALLGNSYRGVGVPDLIRDARAAARFIAQKQ